METCKAKKGSTDAEMQWIEKAQDGKGNLEDMKTLLGGHPKLNVDCIDETGMTALQHAAFRGNFELTKYLLEHGANVNSDKHDNDYTTLMFGALSGNEEVVNVILDAGAKIDAVNSVKRTAAEMASFVAQYHIGGIIQNFLPSKDLEKYTKKTGLETRAKLQKELLKPFHTLICQYNIHPIHLIRELQSNPGLLSDSRYICQILSKLVTEKMSPHNTHESLALKLHYISFIIEKAAASATDNDGNLNSLLKKLATGRSTDGYLQNAEELVRSSLKSYPKPESKLFQMLLLKISQITIGDEPTGIVALTDAINGNRMRTAEDQVCDVCAARQPKKCQGCLQAFYCGQQCQKIHRPTHKKFCIKKPESGS